MNFVGTSGNDVFVGTSHDDTFDLTAGGEDTAEGKNGFDVFSLGAAFTSGDSIDGGGGDNDFVLIAGTYAGFVVNGAMMKNVEFLSLGSGNYQMYFADDVVAAGKSMLVDGGSLGVSESLVFTASEETDGRYTLVGGAGGDGFFMGAGDDTLSGSGGNDQMAPGFGADTVYGGEGDDGVLFDGTGEFDASDHVDGGNGHNGLALTGDYSAGLTITPSMLANVEQITLGLGSFNLTLGNLSVTSSPYFTVNAELMAGDTLVLDGSQFASARLAVYGGPGDDDLTGSIQNDYLAASLGADTMKGGRGDDQYSYGTVADSTGPAFDTIIGFDGDHDHFVVPTFPSGVRPPVEVGRLGAAHFNDDLEAAIGRHEMRDGSAVLFTPSQGTFAGQTFLIVDQGGGAGYQADADLVIHLQNPKHIDHFSLGNFGPVF